MLKLFLREIADVFVKDNFSTIIRHFSEQKILNGGWVFIEISESAAVTNREKRHGLASIPKDIIVTHQSGAGTLTFNYDRFNRDTISYTTTGQCVVRAFVGLYKEEA